jgi:predicted HicB family RNase H-like nuclease
MATKKKEGRVMKATQVRIETELHKALRIAAIEAGVSMNTAINEAVEMWLRERGRKGGKRS